VVLDADHQAHSFEALDTLILTAHASDIAPIVRVNEDTPGLILCVLDIGAQGVLAPQSRTWTTRVVPSQPPYSLPTVLYQALKGGLQNATK
jgi:2-keto-3-deoxy-L-rhamnonate aldolase RhmA